MTKDEMKNRISMALKDPILQQGFEIICKENEELKEENEKLKKEIEISQRCWQEQKNISLDTNCKLHKAKELLKWALHSDPEHNEDFDQKWEEAEQFLKGEL